MQRLSTIIILLLASGCHQAHAVRAAVKTPLLGPFGRANTSNDNAVATTTTTSFYDSPIGDSETTRSKVGELIPPFEELVAADNQPGGIHVGKLLTAMKKMENHMRSVGMKQGANDLASNIDKVEQLYTRAPIDKRDSMSALLQWEIETGGIYGSPSLNKMPSKSAAMGLTWLGHNIRYQHNLYEQMLSDKNCDPVQAALKAFQQHIRPHLSRVVSMMAQATIPKLMPKTQTEFFSTLGGFTPEASPSSLYGPQQDAAIRRDIHAMLGTWEPLLEEWSTVFDNLSLGTV